MPDHTVFAPILGPSTQLGFVVHDLDAAVRHWTDTLGIRPFLFMENGTGRPPRPSRFRGEEVHVELRLAFGVIGGVHIELIQQINDAPSPYLEFLAHGNEGLQHLGYWVHDYHMARAHLEASGYLSEFEICLPGHDETIVYYNSPAVFGPMLEIVPPLWRKSREAIEERLGKWNGGDPLIRYDTYGDFLADAKITFDR